MWNWREVMRQMVLLLRMWRVGLESCAARAGVLVGRGYRAWFAHQSGSKPVCPRAALALGHAHGVSAAWESGPVGIW